MNRCLYCDSEIHPKNLSRYKTQKYCSSSCSNKDSNKKEKSRETHIKRYGVEYPSQSPEIREKITQSFIDRYGVGNPAMNSEIQEKIKNMIKVSLKLNPKSISVEKICVKEIDKDLAKLFLENYHLKGFVDGIHFSAFDGDNLIAVMSFSILNNRKFELSRFIAVNFSYFKLFSKIFNYVQNNLKLTEVVNFSDNKYFEGNIQKNLGFNIVRFIEPDYDYFFKGTRVLKNNIINKNEFVNFPKIYDCGKCEWRWKLH